MLTIHQVTKIAEAGVQLRLSRRRAPQRLMGGYDGTTLEALVYTRNARTREERGVTMLHELIHARDDQEGSRQSTRTI